MPVTELAILRLTTSTYEDPTEFYRNLKRAREVQEKASGYPAYYYRQMEDPFYVYIIGMWDSVEAHLNFLPHEENQAMLQLIRPQIVLNELTMFHIDQSIREKRDIFTSNIINVIRYTVDHEPSRTRASTKPIKVPKYAVGGWAITEDVGDPLGAGHREEFVLFSGWASKRDAIIPTPADMFKHPLIVETKHAERIELERF